MATLSGSGTSFSATYKVEASDAEGTITVEASSYKDAAGNIGPVRNSLTSGALPIVDKIAPVVNKIEITSGVYKGYNYLPLTLINS